MGGGEGRGGGEEGIKRNIYPFTPHVHTKSNLLGVCRRHDSLVNSRCKSIIAVSTQPTYSTRIRVCACMVKSHASLIHTLCLCTLLLLLLSTLKQYCSPDLCDVCESLKILMFACVCALLNLYAYILCSY